VSKLPSKPKTKGPSFMPSTRKGWMDWYIKRYGQLARSKAPERELEVCATQVLWFQLNILAFGDRRYSPLTVKQVKWAEPEEELEPA